MTATIEPNNRRNHERRDEQAEALLRDALLLLAAAGISRSVSWVSRTVREFLRGSVPMPFGLFLVARVEMNASQRRLLAERADLRYLLTYTDPTGETAVRNVARERGEQW